MVVVCACVLYAITPRSRLRCKHPIPLWQIHHVQKTKKKKHGRVHLSLSLYLPLSLATMPLDMSWCLSDVMPGVEGFALSVQISDQRSAIRDQST